MIEDLIRNVLNLPPAKRKIAEDLAEMEKQTADWRREIIPWERENELLLFSLNQDHKWMKQRSGGKMLKGVFYSIYNEPMMVFGYKNYLRKGVHSVLWCSTLEHVFVYRGVGEKTEFFIDGQKIGYITEDGKMYGGGRKRLLGRRNEFSEDYYSMVIWDRPVANVLKPKRIGRVNPRAFEVLEVMERKELLLFLSLSYWTIVMDSYDLQEQD